MRNKDRKRGVKVREMGLDEEHVSLQGANKMTEITKEVLEGVLAECQPNEQYLHDHYDQLLKDWPNKFLVIAAGGDVRKGFRSSAEARKFIEKLDPDKQPGAIVWFMETAESEALSL